MREKRDWGLEAGGRFFFSPRPPASNPITPQNFCPGAYDATEQNQAAIRRLAAEVELLYVVGDRYSANSHKLVEAARAACPRVRLIETPVQIELEELRSVQRVGVSAGASTPDWMIKLVVERLRELEQQARG